MINVYNYKTGQPHTHYNNTRHHRRKRFLNQPILRPDDKDGTRRCNECDNDNSYCDMVGDKDIVARKHFQMINHELISN